MVLFSYLSKQSQNYSHVLSVSFIKTLGDIALDGLQSPGVLLYRFVLANSGPHPISNWQILCSQRFYQYVLLFSDFFYSCSLPSPSEGHIVSLPGCWWNSSAALPLHTIFVDQILTTSSFLQEHRQNITSMILSSEEIHLTYSLKTYKQSHRSSKKGGGHLPVHSTRLCHPG